MLAASVTGYPAQASPDFPKGNEGPIAWSRWVSREGFQQGNVEKLLVFRFGAGPAARVVAL